MFDRVLSSPRSPRRTTALLVATAAAHVVVISGVFIAALWKIEPVPYAVASEVRVSVALEAPPPAGLSPGARLQATKPRQVKRKVVEAVQPVTPPTDPGPATTGPSEPATGPGGGGDDPNGVPDGTPGGTGTCVNEPCGPDTDAPTAKPEPEPEPPPVAPTIVDPKLAAGLRVSGAEQIYPPDAVRLAISRDGRDQVTSTFKVCVGRDGAISSVTTLKGTGYPAYDQALVSGMRGWRYQPYRVDGTAVPMCFVQVWRYRLTR